MAAQSRRANTYVEPYAGGAGVGLKLLRDERVDDIVLNDLDPGIAAFWRTVFDHTDEFVQRIMTTPTTIAEWHHQWSMHQTLDADDLDLGFATFFLNRVNRSGIINARPIGGLAQAGRWRLDARWDAEKLADRVRLVARYRDRVTVTQQDGVEIVRQYASDRQSFIYADPPYLNKAEDLYLNTLEWSDHQRLAAALIAGDRWMLTYDVDDRVGDLYPGLRRATFDIAHTAGIQHVGSEYVVFANGLDVPIDEVLGRRLQFAT